MLYRGDVEPSFTELEVGRILFLSNIPFRFVVPTKKNGMDFDFDIKFGGETACGEVKCKIDDTSRTHETILDSLNTARGQLPADKPGVIFVRLPQAWNVDGADDTHLKDIEEVAFKFFAMGTKRIVSLYFYFSLTLEFKEGTGTVLLGKQMMNHNHRFNRAIDWDISYSHPIISSWISIVELSE
jgi:hypothetical protein